MKTGRFIKINDGIIIKKQSLVGYHKAKYDPNGCHYYIVMRNKNKATYNMYPTSHYIDPKKKTDVKKGNAILMKIKGMDGLTTVYKQPRTKDIHGQPFMDNFKKFETAGMLSDYQIKKLKKWIKK